MENLRKTDSLEAIILRHYRPVSQLAFSLALTVLTVLSLVPINNISYIDAVFWRLPVAADKIAHFVAFVVIAGLLDAFSYQHRFNMAKAAIAFTYGVGIEGLQHLTDYRHPSFGDIVANGLGVLVYWVLTPLLKVTPILRVRWQYQTIAARHFD